MIRELPKLETDRLILRLAEGSDLERIISYFKDNADHLEQWSPVRQAAFFTHKYWQNQVEINKDEFRLDQSMKLFLFDKSNGDLIGDANFTAILRRSAQFCYLGYSLAKDKEGQGYMFEALRASIDYAFATLNLHRIMANHIPENERSSRLLQRLGFTVEGRARDYLLIAGKWQDHIMTSLINDNWLCPE